MSDIFIKPHKVYTEKPDLDKFNMHTHDSYEIFCFLSGNAKYFVEGNIYPLKSGDILIMKKAEAHSLLISSYTPYERIVIHFNAEAIAENLRAPLMEFLDSRPLGVKNRYSASLFHDTNWMYYLNKICSSDDLGVQSIYLTILLSELCERHTEIKPKEASGEEVIDIIQYINHHLADELSLDILCARYFVNKSHINRRFKKIIGTTVWEYITAKRLLLAKELLEGGVTPTNVYAKCGFKDYCTFFRAYKAKFGISPKNSMPKK